VKIAGPDGHASSLGIVEGRSELICIVLVRIAEVLSHGQYGNTQPREIMQCATLKKSWPTGAACKPMNYTHPKYRLIALKPDALAWAIMALTR
jgi:hypothetical protein